MRVHEWEGLGVHTRQYVRAGGRVCALELAKMIGFSVRPRSRHFPHVRRRDDTIFVDYGSFCRDGTLVGPREEVARELAAFTLEECDYVRTEDAIVGVATELVFPRREAEAAWRRFDGDLEKLDEFYSDHVPTAWISAAMQVVIYSQVVPLRAVKK